MQNLYPPHGGGWGEENKLILKTLIFINDLPLNPPHREGQFFKNIPASAFKAGVNFFWHFSALDVILPWKPSDLKDSVLHQLVK